MFRGELPRARGALAAVALALVVLGGGIAFAASSSSQRVIRACYLKQGGAMRYLPANSHCKPSERELSWNAGGHTAPSARLSVHVAAPRQVNQSGGEIVKITVRNGGPDATWVGLNDTASPILRFTPRGAPTTDHGTCFAKTDAFGGVPSRTFTCPIGILEAGQTATVTFGSDVCQDTSSTWSDTARIVGSSYDPAPTHTVARATSKIIPGSGGGCG